MSRAVLDSLYEIQGRNELPSAGGQRWRCGVVRRCHRGPCRPYR